MHPIIYDVAVSIDGFIAGPGGDVSGFAHQGPVVEDYRARLAGYSSAIMGRDTYEFGYRFGLSPGENPYPHMETFVCSATISLPSGADVRQMRNPAGDEVGRLRSRSKGPIYAVGGGRFASALLEEMLLDQIVLKRAPILLGGGTPLFAYVPTGINLRCVDTHDYGNGYLLQRFDVEYGHAL